MLPTPTAHDGSSNGISAASRQGGPSLLDRLRLLPTPTAADSRSAAIQTVLTPGRPTPMGCVTLTDSVRLLPTPRATDGTKGCPAQRGSKGDLMLPSVVMRLLAPPTTLDTGDGIS